MSILSRWGSVLIAAVVTAGVLAAEPPKVEINLKDVDAVVFHQSTSPDYHAVDLRLTAAGVERLSRAMATAPDRTVVVLFEGRRLGRHSAPGGVPLKEVLALVTTSRREALSFIADVAEKDDRIKIVACPTETVDRRPE